MCREVTNDLLDKEPTAKSRHLGNEIAGSVLQNMSGMNRATNAMASSQPEEIPSTEKDRHCTGE